MSKEDIERLLRKQSSLQKRIRRRERQLYLKNGAEQLVYQTEQLLSENGDKFAADDKAALEGKTEALKEALKGDNLDAIKSAQDDLQNKFYEVSQKMYQAAAPQGDAGADPNAQAGGDGYTDADYTEVEDN
jgi:molecular chaperone DnaK